MSVSQEAPLLQAQDESPAKPKFTLVIHGGAEVVDISRLTPEQHAAYKAALSRALLAGYTVLRAGGEAMDAAVAAVSSMEDCPLFNAGRGAVFNAAGKNELESSIMLSRPPSSHPSIPASRRGTAITLLRHVRNSCKLARALYLSPITAYHTMFSGEAAESLGASLGVEMVDESYFYTEERWREHCRDLRLPEEPLPYPPTPGNSDEGATNIPLNTLPKGTVGAVALDVRGCIASVTSTGGRCNKVPGRIGDTPVMGAGFWAEEWTVSAEESKKVAMGVSCTGDGDYFIRHAVGSNIGRRMKYLHEPISVAARACLKDLHRDEGEGGVVGLDNAGNVVLDPNCSGMYRGVIYEDGIPKTAIYDHDELD